MRDNFIDILRFIGLSMIILAHSNPPEVLFQLRNFDVPLMVLVSGMAFSLSYKGNQSYFSFVWKRIKRLVFPVWIFLTILFAAAFLIKYNKILDLKTIITSYALISGIGYVWVIRVFLIVSLLAPILGVFNTKIRSNLIFIIALMFVQVIFDVLFSSLKILNSSIFHLLSITILDVLPFSLVFLFGMRMSTFNHREQSRLAILFGLIFIGYATFFYTTEHVFVSTQDYKYPPASYYLDYALFVSMLLCLFKEQVIKIFHLISGVVHHISMNSIWTYLWHIPLVFALHINWLAKFIVVYVVAASISWAQVQFVKYLSSKEYINDKSKKLINNLFTG